jgi:hypothetical protein
LPKYRGISLFLLTVNAALTARNKHHGLLNAVCIAAPSVDWRERKKGSGFPKPLKIVIFK